jgi:ubiquitin C-terminal hydrolase
VSSYRSSAGAHVPRDFINAMDKCPPLDLFTDRDQHDSQEFLRMLLDNLNDELNTVARWGYTS